MDQWKQVFRARGLDIQQLSILDNNDYLHDHRITRKAEILQWVQMYNLNPDQLVIIDDDRSLNDLPPAFKERLVLTNSYTGLNHLSTLSSILKRRLKRRLLK